MNTRANLGLMLSRRADRSPHLEAFVQVETGLRLTWSELDARTNQTANVLSGLGISKGDRVALLLMNGPEIFESFMAVAKLGAIAVPLNWRLVPNELSILLQDSGSTALIFGADFDENVCDLEQRGEHGTPVRHWLRVGDDAGPAFALSYADLQAQAPDHEPEIAAWGDDDVVILYTSGTTGRPKGAVHSHRSAIWGALTWGSDLDVRYRDIYLIFMPGFHVGALNPFAVCVGRGATCVVMRSFDPKLAWAVCERERVTNFIAVPAMLNVMLPYVEEGKVDASSVRWILTGASPIPKSLLEAYTSHAIEIVSAYGLTEAYGHGCILTSDQAAARLGSVGKPFYQMEARVVDDNGKDCPPGEAGEVLLRGPCVMQRYWQRPEATAETLRDGWLHTGDGAVLDDDGFFYIRDRIKDMIISGGENIYPAEIENVLHGHPAIADVAVIGQPSQRWGESPFAIVVRGEPTLTEEDVLSFCQGRVARFKQPRGVAFVEELPRNPSGKLLKHELRERFPGPAPE